MNKSLNRHDLNIDVFNKPNTKFITKEDKFWYSLISYHPIIPKIYGLPKTHKPRIPLRLIISRIETNVHNIEKSFAKIFSSLLGMISNSQIKNSGDLLNKIKMENKYFSIKTIHQYSC